MKKEISANRTPRRAPRFSERTDHKRRGHLFRAEIVSFRLTVFMIEEKRVKDLLILSLIELSKTAPLAAFIRL